MQLPCSLLDTALSRHCVLLDEQEATEKKVGALVRPSCTARLLARSPGTPYPLLPPSPCYPAIAPLSGASEPARERSNHHTVADAAEDAAVGEQEEHPFGL